MRIGIFDSGFGGLSKRGAFLFGSIPLCSHGIKFHPMKYPMRSHKGIPYFVYPRKDAKGVFYYRFTLEKDGENHHRSTRQTSLKEALLVTAKAIDEALEKKAQEALPEPQEKTQSPLFREAMEEWLTMKKGAVKGHTMTNITRYLGFTEKVRPGCRFSDFTIPSYHKILHDIRAMVKPAASYWSNILVAQNEFFNWCILTGKTTLNPTLGYQRPKKAEFGIYEQTIPDSEFETFCAHLLPSDEFACRWFRYTGTYPADFAFAEKQDFYLKEGILHLRMKRAKNRFKYHQPLDGRIEPAVRAIWETKKLPTDRMFTHIGGEPDGRPYLTWYTLMQKRVYKVWLLLLGRFYKIGAFRHTWVTDCIERGVPEDVLLEWAGHSKRSTIYRERYLHRKSTTRFRYVESPSSPPSRSLQHDGIGSP